MLPKRNCKFRNMRVWYRNQAVNRNGLCCRNHRRTEFWRGTRRPKQISVLSETEEGKVSEEWVGKRQLLALRFCHSRLNGSAFNNLAGALPGMLRVLDPHSSFFD